MIKSFFSRQFVVFLLTGGLAAIVNFGSRIIYSHWLSFSSAVIAAYLSGMIVAFILAKLLVFGGTRHSTLKSAMFFTLVNFFGALQTWAVSIVLAEHLLPKFGLSHAQEWGHLAGIMVPVFTSYLGHKYLSFGQ